MTDFANAHEFVRVTGGSSRQLLDDPTDTALAPGGAATLTPAERTARLWNDLQGTWSGHTGLNVIAVPAPGSKPSAIGAFQLLVNPYTELLSFLNPGAPARNRGGDVDQFVAALEYQQRVTDRNTDALLHVENGMFLNLSTIVANGTTTKEPIPEFNIARSGTIPHGDSILLLGTPPEVSSGAPDIPDESAIPTNLGDPPPLGYTDPYLDQPDGVDAANPNSTLRTALADQQAAGFTVLETTTFAFDSAHGGDVANIPYIVQRANATRMRAMFWLEKVRSPTGQEFDQLQYSQVIDVEFHHHSTDPSSGLIVWPHITVNTLVKQ